MLRGSEEKEKEEVEAVKKVKRYIPPSSAGFSFFITGEDIQLRVYYNAAQYKIDKKDSWGNIKSWKRYALTDSNEEVLFTPNGIKQGGVVN